MHRTSKSVNFALLVASLVTAGAGMPPRQAFAYDAPLPATQIYEQVHQQMCAVLALSKSGEEIGLGSGFVWADDQIVTNRHVVAGADTVRLDCNGIHATATKILRHSNEIDLVVIAAELGLRRTLKVRQTPVKPGEQVYAIGNPLGLSNTITSGIVGGVRSIGEIEYLQISADINPGNSGGPIVDQSGNVIAVATMRAREAQGLNFAIPIKYVLSLPKNEKALEDIKGNDGASASIVQILSSLEFRGLPLGTPCEDVTRLEHIGTLSGSFDDKRFVRNMTGVVEGKAPLFGRVVSVRYGCLYGAISYGTYLAIPKDILRFVTDGLEAKYGKPINGAPRSIPTEFRARHILVETEIIARQIIDELENGADFATLARSYSTGPSNLSGGDLGWVSPDMMVRPFSDAVLGLEDGEFTSDPVQTQFGWHVILREASRGSSSELLADLIWNLGDGQTIVLKTRGFQSELYYLDDKLSEMLKRKEILRAVESNDL